MPNPEPGADPARTHDLVLLAGPLVAGGRSLARTDEGQVVFVEGALPGDRVRVEVTGSKRGFLSGAAVEVLEASPHRVDPPCPYVLAGCGGCDLQHEAPADQPALKLAIVADALKRQAGLEHPPLKVGPALNGTGYRTTARMVVVDGRLAYYRRASHDPVPVESCLVLHPLLDEIVRDGRFPGAAEVTLRVGARTGERLVIVAPTTKAVEVEVPDGVKVVGAAELRGGKRAWYHEEVAGRTWQISANSFFQAGIQGAETLVAAVQRAAGTRTEGMRVLDAYSGVGLLGGALWRPGVELTSVEHSRSSIRDAKINLADTGAKIVATSVEKLRTPRADLVIADPSREGLGRKATEVLASSGAPSLVLVSCDPASYGRDTALLAGHGFRLSSAELVDLFPHTSHVEVVSRFDR